ncbi:MAG TPA: class I adenylate-forming enzyme family protein [Myxococcota bacterium]|nr:class I adenylate-forming enzyme family protein [Myxococcota bacterium]
MTLEFKTSEIPGHAQAERELLLPDGPFRVVTEDVLGVPTPVFQERLPSLRALLEGSRAFGDAEFMVYDDRRIGFAEHHRMVASVAKALREKLGVGPGDRVAILAANCPEWIVTWWATVSLGAVAVGLNGWWVRDEIVYGVEDCGAKVLVGDRKRLERLRPGDVSIPVVVIEDDFEKLASYDLGADLPDVPIDEDDPACILYTSGTTGRPKGAVNTHRNIVAVNRIQVWHGLRLMKIQGPPPPGAPPPRPRCMLVSAPLFHVSGLYAGAVTLLAGGVKTVWMKGRFDPAETLATIEREQVTSWGPMGNMLHRCMEHPDAGRYDLSSVVQCGSGGAPISRELQDRMRAFFPNARRQLGLGYGLTENTGLATINFGAELEAHPDSVGRLLPTIGCEIRDPDSGRALGTGEEGEIFLSGPLVMRGYHGKPEATAESIRAGRWLRTGDWGRLDEHGYLYVNSRRRDLILRAGENVYPAEIEQRLEAHPDVAEAAVVGVDHPTLGQEVKAVLVPRPGVTLDPAELARFVGETLAYYKVPSQWETRSEPLPRNASGKVLKDVVLGESENRFVEE